jgi:hypothetical protein
MSEEQLTLIQGGEFIVCEDVVFRAAAENPALLTATTSLPINTMKPVAVRLEGEIIPLPMIRSQERRIVSNKIRIDGPLAGRIAASIGLKSALA